MENLRDQFVYGLHDKELQRRLLSEDSLTFDNALKVAESYDVAQRDATGIRSESNDYQVNNLRLPSNKKYTFKNKNSPKHLSKPLKNSVNKNDNSGKETNQKFKLVCFRCGGPHLANFEKCPGKNQQYNVCKKRGHLAKMCRFKKNEGRNNFFSSNVVFTVNECNKTNEDYNSGLIYKTGIVNETIINFLIDCGSQVSTLTYRTFSKIKNVDLKPTNIGLEIFTKQVIEVVGCCYLTVELEEVEKLQKFIVVAAGRDALGTEYIN